MNTSLSSSVAPKKTQDPRQRLSHDELRADDAGQKPDQGLGQPPYPDDARAHRILNQPGERPGQQPRHGPARQRDIDDHHQHEIQSHPAANVSGERPLKRERRGHGQDDPGSPHSTLPSAASRAGVGVRTTSTSSRLVKSTAGLTVIVVYALPPLLDRFDLPDQIPLRINAVDTRRDHEVADHHVGHFRDVVHAESRIARRRSRRPARATVRPGLPPAALRSMSS